MSITYAPHVAALHDKMLRKRLWIVITKAVVPPEELSKLLEADTAPGRGVRAPS